MPHLTRVARKSRDGGGVLVDEAGFPFSVPAISTLAPLDVNADVTFFVGENGSGKSTLLEGIACAAELPSVGASQVAYDDSLSHQRVLAGDLRLSWSPRSRQGFFLRAEDFFGYLKYEARTDARIVREKTEHEDVKLELTGDAVHPDEKNAAGFLRARDSRSHGESFMELFLRRVRAGGLYLLDEPEAPLSMTRQLALLGLILKAARSGAQFIIATHSPILLACPGARIYSFDKVPIAEVAYRDLEQVNLARDFLIDPQRYLEHLALD